MDTPICDFVQAYQKKAALRLHMPGHKGRSFLGMESLDITEIQGADELYHARGIIKKSEENASALFGSGKTLYSAEGSSLCIRAMVHLALLHAKSSGAAPVILAGRNAHKAFLSACAFLDADAAWLWPDKQESLISCEITPDGLEKALSALPQKPAAVYVTSPDYLGNTLDISALAQVCHARGTPLLVDNAHGAYLRFLPRDRHPITLGADLCCDSAHKTLPVLTGGAYLHFGKATPGDMLENGERALALFASSSPSYLILQSLDRCNAYLAEAYPQRLKIFIPKLASLKEKLVGHGYALAGSEPLKLTIAPKAFGYTGDQLHDALRMKNMECEFSDPDFLTAMLSPENGCVHLARLESTLLSIPPRPPVSSLPPPPPRPEKALSIRDALLSPSRELPVEHTAGRVFADAQVGCPPCIPIIMSGERIDQNAIECFRYYGIEKVRVTA